MDVVLWSAQSNLEDNMPNWSTSFMRYIGPYKIAHWLRKNDYSCQVIDFITELDETQLYELTSKFITQDTLVLGISTTFMCLSKYLNPTTKRIQRVPDHALRVLFRLKAEFPKLKIVYGGHAAERVDSYDIADATVMSYTTAPEDVFLEYVKFVKYNSDEPYYTLVAPTMTDNPNPKLRKHYFSARNQVYNIEVDDFKFSKDDGILSGEPLPLDISRGCIFKCRFCQYTHLGKKKLDYIRSMKLVEEELLYNYENFQTTKYYILDDTFNDTEIKVKAFLDMTKRLPFKISFVGYTRADLLHRYPNTIHMLKEAGLAGTFFGLESFHPSASKIVGKGWSGKHGKTFVPELYHNIWNNEVSVHTNFIVGLPGETQEDIKETIQWFIDNDMCSINFARLSMYGPTSKMPHSVLSEFDKNAEKYGFTWGNYDVLMESRIWYNDTWNAASATVFTKFANRFTKAHRKVTPWLMLEVEWLGYTREDLLTKKINEFDWDVVQSIRDKKFKEYFNLLEHPKAPPNVQG